jgi:transposase-like protein
MAESQALPLSAFCCQNERCAEYGKKGLDNIYFHCWGNRKQTIRKLRCRTCQESFSERKGTVWYQSKLPREKALAIARHLSEGDGIRKTGRLVGATQETVIRLNRLLGEHGKALHEEKVRGVRVREAQGDEMWSFVGKKREAVRPKQPR